MGLGLRCLRYPSSAAKGIQIGSEPWIGLGLRCLTSTGVAGTMQSQLLTAPLTRVPPTVTVVTILLILHQ